MNRRLQLTYLLLLCLLFSSITPTFSQKISIPDSLYHEVILLKAQPTSEVRNNKILTLFFELIMHYHPNVKGNWRDSLFTYTNLYKSEYGKNLSNLAKAEIMLQEGDINTGAITFTKAIENLEKKGFYAQAAFGLMRMGAMRQVINKTKAEETDYPLYYKQALALANKSRHPGYQVLALCYLASWQLEKQNFNETIRIANQILQTVAQDKTNSSFQYIGNAYRYFAYAYIGLEDETKAKKYFNLARQWTRSEGRSFFLEYTIYHSFADLYNKKKLYKKALLQCDSAIAKLIYWKAKARLIDADKYLSNIYEIKYKTFKKIGNADSALVYHEKLSSQIDANIHTEVEKNYKDFQAKYKVKEKELQISNLNNKILKDESRNGKILNYFLLSTLLLLIIVSGLVFRSLRLQQKNTLFSFELSKAKTELVKQVIETQETERQRLAKDLHDELGGTLSIIKAKVAQETANSATINLVEKAINDLRLVSRNLMPPELASEGLSRAIYYTLERIQSSSDIEFTFITFGEEQRQNQETELNIYRIVTELLNNILKHSKATKAVVQLIYYAESLSILVEDNGVGIKKNQNDWGIGLKNINSRVEFLNARIHMDFGIGGTTTVIEVPIKVVFNET
jgi:signal transduction histidine kinase